MAFIHWSQLSPKVVLLKLDGSSSDATSGVGGLETVDNSGALLTNQCSSPSRSSSEVRSTGCSNQSCLRVPCRFDDKKNQNKKVTKNAARGESQMR